MQFFQVIIIEQYDVEFKFNYFIAVSVQAFIPNSLASKTSSDLVRASFRFQMKQDIPDRKQTIEFFDRRLKNRYFGIRHGQSEANVQEIISSDPQTASSYPLTECGRNQAEGILEHHIPKL